MVLGGFLLLAAIRGELPSTAPNALLFLYLISGAATMAAAALVADRDFAARWPLLVPALVPPILLACGLWALFPSWRSALPPSPAGGVAGVTLLLLSLAPWVPLVIRARGREAHRADALAAREAMNARQAELDRQTALDQLAAMSPETPLPDWMSLAEPGSPIREEALERIRQLPRRQGDAESMLARGAWSVMVELPHFQLEATDRLCASASRFLDLQFPPFQADRPDLPEFNRLAYRFESYLPGLGWLGQAGCDLRPALARLTAVVRTYPEGSERSELLRLLEAAKVFPG